MQKTKSLLSFLYMAVHTRLSIATTTNVLVPQFAAGQTPQNGFGQASKSFATQCPPSTLGKHSSSFSTPRTGIGNFAEAGRGGSVSDFGNFLDQARNGQC
jgi:hypothetical protein